MPAYDYKCEKCTHEFEIIRSISAQDAPYCPKCNSNKIKRIYSSAGIIFKGSGFYVTDYKNKTAKNSSGSASNGSSKKSNEDIVSAKSDKKI